MKLKIKYIPNSKGETVNKPFYATSGSAGMDLSACLDEPVEYVAYIYARSGLACKKGICLANSVGVVDSDYRGEIKCGLINLSNEDFTVNHGDRIAQLVIAPVAIAEIEECETLDETQRGAGGFGSTGV